MGPRRWISLAICVAGSLSVAFAASSSSGSPPSSSAAAGPRSAHKLATVNVTASRFHDKHQLEGLAMHFVRAHAAPSPTIHQLGRWREPVCPVTVGLRSSYDKLVSGRVTRIAARVGAPARRPGKRCAANVEIVFTQDAQGLLNHLARKYRQLVGFPSAGHPPAFHGPIESWYLTATRALGGWSPPAGSTMGLSAPKGSYESGEVSALPAGATIDVPGGYPPDGMAGSHLTAGFESEFVYVLVIVNAKEIAGYTLRSIADYVAMLALTRMTPPATCSALPSITDLLAPQCPETPKPSEFTPEDYAYLNALYSSSLDANLNIEEGAIRSRLVSAIAGR